MRKLRIFLCHASSDKEGVRVLYDRLVGDGYAPWLDEENLLPGQEWKWEIPKAVRAADVVIVCLSAAFNAAGYRQKEVRVALDAANQQPEGAIFVIPVKLEECNVPDGLAQFQWVNLDTTNGYAKLLRSLHERAENLGLRTSAGTADPNRNSNSREAAAATALLQQHGQAAAQIRKYAIEKAIANSWKRASQFGEQELINNTGLSPKLLYPILDALRTVGQLVCVNWKGQPVWAPADALREYAYPTGGCRAVAHKAAYTFLARRPKIADEDLQQARSHACAAIEEVYPGASAALFSLDEILDTALSEAIADLERSPRKPKFELRDKQG